jgi:hypothetical protein
VGTIKCQANAAAAAPLNSTVRQHMSLPFYVSCDWKSPLLYELPGDRFQVMAEGSIGPFVAGYQFLLMTLHSRNF